MSKSVSAKQTRIVELLNASRGETRILDPAVKKVLANGSEFVVGLGLYTATSSDVRTVFNCAEIDPSKLENWLLVLEVVMEEALGKNALSRWNIDRRLQLHRDAAAIEIAAGPRTNIAVSRQLISKHPRRYGHLKPKSLSRQLSKAMRRLDRSAALTS
jgi:hypothetical protein